MKAFFGDDLLLSGDAARGLYESVRDLPIIDYHCHLNEKEIRDDLTFPNLGKLWLGGDHYKWRAMRLCGVDERLITGDADDREKYLAYASVLPKLAGNQLYYWTHLELKLLFGINEPLNPASAGRIWDEANAKLASISVRGLLDRFRVEYIATTDDPASDLSAHGIYGNTRVAPTFRPDSALNLDENALTALEKAAGITIRTLDDLKAALVARLDFFRTKGCRIADHGMDFAPVADPGEGAADVIFAKRRDANAEEKLAFFSHVLAFLAKEYAKRGMVMQLHFATLRNVNSRAFRALGRDMGYDVMRDSASIDRLIGFFDSLDRDGALPKTVLYSLNPQFVPALATMTGAFPNLRVGAAWWFNDSVEGIRRQLSTVAEYAALGTNLGMLTDSRSFASYARFDFFRRILSDTVGGWVERGEYDLDGAKELMLDVCYRNVRDFLEI